MSAWSSRRKIAIIATATVIVIFILSGVLFLLFHTPPSCNDGIQNGGEFGIDCGKVCKKECPVPRKKILDVWTRAFLVADGIYSAVAYVENRNEDLYAPEALFEIKLYDENGSSVNWAKQTTPIMPGGITPIFVPYIKTGERNVVRASFRFIKEPELRKSTHKHNFEIKDVKLNTSEDEPPTVSAMVRNKSEKTIKEVDFVAILSDEDGDAVAASRTSEKNIRPGEEHLIQYSWVNQPILQKGECPGGLCIKQIKQVEILPVINEW